MRFNKKSRISAEMTALLEKKLLLQRL